MPFSFAEYQSNSARTAIYPRARALEYVSLGLVGEAGEVANKVKKIIRDGGYAGGAVTADQASAIAAEMGDVLWYLAALSREIGVDLGAVAQANLEKLESRLERGTIQGSGDNR